MIGSSRGRRVVRLLHVARAARERFAISDELFASSGRLVFANPRAARALAERFNRTRPPERRVSGGELVAAGLLHELAHLFVERHRREVDPGVLAAPLTDLGEDLGREQLESLLATFVDEFPPRAVAVGEQAVEAFLERMPEGRELALEELLLLWLAGANPALERLAELFDDRRLRVSTPYLEAMRRLESLLAVRSATGPRGESLIELLRAPVRAAPDSLEGQLAFVRREWAGLLGPELERVLGALDLFAEERKGGLPPGPGPVEAPDLADLAEAFEAFSADLDWMPRVVMLAKSAHVWLAQLSRTHGRPISRLDEIPDSELDRLAARGFTGLWLIGVWQRSRASARIKRMMGDAEAVASAYAIDDYRVADELGGEEALAGLRERAWRRGIRLASDMVPNHMGIDSRWVIEHPERFLGLDQCPFPGYRFTGPDLCDDERVGVYLEDGYWDRSDAAVAFKRVDHLTGAERYLYHGNDGTSMPWNDTAQLDYLKPEVREAVIEAILAVARRTPIIRFDAAMTLTRRHYHRLWFPAPGEGGDIPSRAEHGMTRAAFERAMPRELWREVVDRVAAEAPDTLLLAEAFWLLEGYFVRTLGMHRVYNSAFMNMLRDERNADYRRMVRETLELDPRILERYVNFLSNPDERTAIDQFGDGGKYLGCAILLATMPGLPMFAHGQVEGLREKYGMEFDRPRWDEVPDQALVELHERVVFPLLRRRPLFAGVERFALFDLVRDDGTVDENVFAYANALGGESALVLYHNRYAETEGTVDRSAARVVRDGAGEGRLERIGLAEALGVPDDAGSFVVVRDAVSGLEHLWSCRELAARGLRVRLQAYEARVLCDPQVIADDARGSWRAACDVLAGAGVASVDEHRRELLYAPIRKPFRRLVDPARLARLVEAVGQGDDADRRAELDAAEEILVELAAAIVGLAGLEAQPAPTVDLEAVLAAAVEAGRLLEAEVGTRGPIAQVVALGPTFAAPLVAWRILTELGRALGGEEGGEAARSWLDEWRLEVVLAEELVGAGLEPLAAGRAAATVEAQLACEGWAADERPPLSTARSLLERLLAEPGPSRCLGVNRHGGVVYVHQESFEAALAWLLAGALLDEEREPGEGIAERALAAVRALVAAEERSGFEVETMLAALDE